VNDVRQKLFQYRGYTPIPFILMMITFANPTDMTMLVGAAVALLGESVRFWGVAYAGSLTRATGGVGAPEVVMAGPYAFVRNPLYLGNIIMYCGVGIAANALVPWLVLIALVYFAIQYALIVSLEEEFLEREFGAGYREYKRGVPRFFPRLTPFVHPASASQRPNWEEAFRSERRTLQALALVLLILVVIWVRS
jgi:protein-S-isoprenylcysteine O-methyltransferase Ste14